LIAKQRPIYEEQAVGLGTGYLMKFNFKGELIAQLRLGKDSVYHPGGIDFDGQYIWIPVCEYRPHGRSLIYRIDLTTMEAKVEFTVDDAIGALVCDRDRHELVGFNWDAMQFYTWKQQLLDRGKWHLKSISNNNQHFIHFQDGQYVGQGLMICSGVNSFLKDPHAKERIVIGGIQLMDIHTYQSTYTLPIHLISKTGRIMTSNPFYTDVVDGKVCLYFVPDDDQSTLYMYEITNSKS